MFHNTPHIYAVFDGQGDFTTGLAATKAKAEAAVLAKIRKDYGTEKGCPTAYDDDACSAFSVEMGDGMQWSIRPVTVPEVAPLSEHDAAPVMASIDASPWPFLAAFAVAVLIQKQDPSEAAEDNLKSVEESKT